MNNQKEISNPFTARTPVSGKAFFGRETLLKKLFNYINAGESISLAGERRTGKTSILRRVQEVKEQYLSNSGRHLFVPVDFQGLEFRSEELLWTGILTSLLEQAGIAEPGTNTISKTIEQIHSGRLVVQTLLLRLFRSLAKDGIRITFLFDEFETTAQGEKPVDLRFYKILRNIALDRGTKVNYVIATRQELSKVEKSLELQFTTLSSPLFNIFHQLLILPFSEDEARQMVNGLLQSADLDLGAKLSFWLQKNLLFELSGFHPFFLQIACYQLFESCVLADGTFAEQVPEDEIRSAFQSEANDHFSYYWEISSPEEKEVMRQLAIHPDKIDGTTQRYILNLLRNRCLAIKRDKAEPEWQLFSSALVQWINEQHVRDIDKPEQLPGDYFVGRRDELEAFKRCVSSQTQNGIYYFGPGGIGKSMLLKKIIAFSENELNCQTVFIDFFSTQNRSIEGLQSTICEKFSDTQAFEEVIHLRQKIEDIRQGSDFSYRTELISSLQKQSEVIFSRCCNQATKDKLIVLVFDSFEYVQRRDIGRWFAGDFLPHLKKDGTHGLIVVLAGRPEPKPASTPANILQYPLSGLTKEEVREYVQRLGISWEDTLDPLYQGSRGNPLLIELLRWRGRRELMTEPQRLQEILSQPEVMAQDIFDKISEISPINRVLWAMAVLKRRFDIHMLEYLVDNMLWLRNADYEAIQNALRALPFVKSDEEASSHLLHDAVVEPISIVFKQVDETGQLEQKLRQKIVDEYYPEQILATQSQDERMYLRAEQLGYILDQDLEAGMTKYRTSLEEVRQQHNYEFEGLLWGELSEHLAEYPSKTFDIMLEKAKWLYENGLYRELEPVSRSIYEMQGIAPEDRLLGSRHLGFALMNQGKLHEAEQQFQESLKIAQQLRADTHIAATEENFGQLAMLTGKYEEASEHYWRSIQLYTHVDEPRKLAAVYSVRGRSLALQGHYQRALNHCQYALKILENNPDIRRQVEALCDMGIIYRLIGDYDTARAHLTQALKLADQERFIESEADIYRELADTNYLRGRSAREEDNNFSLDCDAQAHALDALVTSLEKARTIAHRICISRGLIRLAYVFEEIARLEPSKTGSSEFPSLLVEELLEEARSVRIVEDVYWLRHGFEHFPDKAFSELTLLQKVVRLLEIGALEATEAHQFHIAIQSQIELTRILLELGAREDVKKRIEKIKQTPPGVYDDQILLALGTLIQADLAFDSGDLNSALTRYAQAFPIIAKTYGTDPDLIHGRIHELLKRIKSIESVETALDWCRILQETWVDAHLDDVFPLVIERLQMLSYELRRKLTEITHGKDISD